MINVLYVPKLQKQISSLRYKHDKVVDLTFKLFGGPDNLGVMRDILNARVCKSNKLKSLDEELQESVYNKLLDPFFYILIEKSPYSYIQQEIVDIKKGSNLSIKLGILDHFLCNLNGGTNHLSLEQRIDIFNGYLEGLSPYCTANLTKVRDKLVRDKWKKYGFESKRKVGRPRINVSEEQKRMIIEQYFNQVSLENMKTNIGLERQKITGVIEELKLPIRINPQTEISNLKEVYMLLDEGLSISDTCKLKSINHGSVAYYIKNREKNERIIKEFERQKEEYFTNFNIPKTSLETYL